jgi:hypothetical protein
MNECRYGSVVRVQGARARGSLLWRRDGTAARRRGPPSSQRGQRLRQRRRRADGRGRGPDQRGSVPHVGQSLPVGDQLQRPADGQADRHGVVRRGLQGHVEGSRRGGEALHQAEPRRTTHSRVPCRDGLPLRAPSPQHRPLHRYAHARTSTHKHARMQASCACTSDIVCVCVCV